LKISSTVLIKFITNNKTIARVVKIIVASKMKLYKYYLFYILPKYVERNIKVIYWLEIFGPICSKINIL